MGCYGSKEHRHSSIEGGRADSGTVVRAATNQAAPQPCAASSQVTRTTSVRRTKLIEPHAWWHASCSTSAYIGPVAQVEVAEEPPVTLTPEEQAIVNRLVELNGAVLLLPWSPRCKSQTFLGADHDAEQERTRAASVQRALATAASYEAADAIRAWSPPIKGLYSPLPRCKSQTFLGADHDAEQECTRAASVQRALAIAASYEAADAIRGAELVPGQLEPEAIVNRLVELNGAVLLLPWSPRCKSQTFLGADHDAEQERTRAASVQRALATAASYEAADAMIADEAADAMIVVRGIAI